MESAQISPGAIPGYEADIPNTCILTGWIEPRKVNYVDGEPSARFLSSCWMDSARAHSTKHKR